MTEQSRNSNLADNMAEVPGFAAVALEGTQFADLIRVGYQLMVPYSYRLSHLFHQKVSEPVLGYTELYGRTASENIYRIDILGRMANLFDIRETRRFIYHELTEAEIERAILQLGVPLLLGRRPTTRLKEVVLALGKPITQIDALDQTQGRSTTIVRDFNHGRMDIPIGIVEI